MKDGELTMTKEPAEDNRHASLKPYVTALVERLCDGLSGENAVGGVLVIILYKFLEEFRDEFERWPHLLLIIDRDFPWLKLQQDLCSLFSRIMPVRRSDRLKDIYTYISEGKDTLLLNQSDPVAPSVQEATIKSCISMDGVLMGLRIVVSHTPASLSFARHSVSVKLQSSQSYFYRGLIDTPGPAIVPSDLRQLIQEDMSNKDAIQYQYEPTYPLRCLARALWRHGDLTTEWLDLITEVLDQSSKYSRRTEYYNEDIEVLSSVLVFVERFGSTITSRDGEYTMPIEFLMLVDFVRMDGRKLLGVSPKKVHQILCKYVEAKFPRPRISPNGGTKDAVSGKPLQRTCVIVNIPQLVAALDGRTERRSV